MALWIVRHATPLIASGVCYGALDVAADKQQTLQAARSLAQAIPPHCKVWVSPLQRCMQLADALSDMCPQLKPQTETRLREMDFGKWEGVAWDAIPLAVMQAWTDDFGEHRFGGVESANQVLVRVAELWAAARQHPDEPQVWITHAGVARAVRLLSQGFRSVSSASQWPKDAPSYGKWWHIDF